MASPLMPYFAKALSSSTLKSLKRNIYHADRKLSGKRSKLEIFLGIDDPYSYLLIQVLPKFIKRFKVEVSFHTVYERDTEMYPALEMSKRYAIQDAKYLAELYQLAFPTTINSTISAEVAQAATMQLLATEKESDFLTQANNIFTQVWQNSDLNQAQKNQLNQPTLRAHLTRNQELLKKRGHYFGAMIYFEGEWYWGIDRLDHLEDRLITLGLANKSNEKVQFNRTYKDFCNVTPQPINTSKEKEPLIIYWSARSPYSYLGLIRSIQLVEFYQIPLKIKPVLPMMMRGMNVPRSKKMYIFLDTKREAEKYGIPYGFVADPLGAAVERCYALLDYAKKENKLTKFLISFSQAVNAEGIRAETDKGLKVIVERCGLSWSIAKAQLTNTQWKSEVNNNLTEMYKSGCWGVPSFRYNGNSYWGQDRLGIIEKQIQKHSLRN